MRGTRKRKEKRKRKSLPIKGSDPDCFLGEVYKILKEIILELGSQPFEERKISRYMLGLDHGVSCI